MRVITGQARGRKLITVEGMDVRPTTDKVKESVFNIIQFDVPCAKVLDLFCGSGQMGIEALSRDADFCVFVDSSKKSQEVTKQNLANTNLYKKARVVAMDYQSFLTTTKDTFDIAFLDPPYHKNILPNALSLLVDKMNENGIILCEHEDDEEIPQEVGKFRRVKQYHYGRICISAYINNSDEI